MIAWVAYATQPTNTSQIFLALRCCVAALLRTQRSNAATPPPDMHLFFFKSYMRCHFGMAATTIGDIGGTLQITPKTSNDSKAPKAQILQGLHTPRHPKVRFVER
jgi:hypothetical protein